MPKTRKSIALAMGGVVVMGCLAACGDRITANHDWQALVTPSAYNEQVYIPGFPTPYARTHFTLTGSLVDARQRPVAGTFVRQNCYEVPGIPGQVQMFCQVIVDAGQRIYVASGTSKGIFGTFQSADSPTSSGSLSLSEIRLADTGDGMIHYLIKVAAHTG
jgi:hypothetical protein